METAELETYLGKKRARFTEFVPTGSLWLDWVIGGWPLGCTSEIFGSPGSGASTLALHCVAQMKSDGCPCDLLPVFEDPLRSFSPAYARRIGVNLDSAVVLPGKAIIVGRTFMDSETFRVADPLLDSTACRAGTTLAVTQYRSDLERGGLVRNLDARASVAVELREGKPFKGGHWVTATVRHNAFDPSTVSHGVTWRLVFDRGIDTADELLRLGLAYGEISKRGNYYHWAGHCIGAGRKQARAWLRGCPEHADRIRRDLWCGKLQAREF